VSTIGKNYQSRVDYSLGEPENPMDDTAIMEKFRGLTAYCGISDVVADIIIDNVYNGKIITKINIC
jgi:hypothetical protein